MSKKILISSLLVAILGIGTVGTAVALNVRGDDQTTNVNNDLPNHDGIHSTYPRLSTKINTDKMNEITFTFEVLNPEEYSIKYVSINIPNYGMVYKTNLNTETKEWKDTITVDNINAGTYANASMCVFFEQNHYTKENDDDTMYTEVKLPTFNVKGKSFVEGKDNFNEINLEANNVTSNSADMHARYKINSGNIQNVKLINVTDERNNTYDYVDPFRERDGIDITDEIRSEGDNYYQVNHRINNLNENEEYKYRLIVTTDVNDLSYVKGDSKYASNGENSFYYYDVKFKTKSSSTSSPSVDINTHANTTDATMSYSIDRNETQVVNVSLYDNKNNVIRDFNNQLSSSYHFTNLSPNTEYNYHIGVSYYETGSYDELPDTLFNTYPVNFRTEAIINTEEPSISVDSSTTTNSSTISFNINSNGNEINDVKLIDSSGSTIKDFGTSTSGSYTISGLSPNVTYTYKLKTNYNNGKDNLTKDTIVQFTTKEDNTGGGGGTTTSSPSINIDIASLTSTSVSLVYTINPHGASVKTVKFLDYRGYQIYNLGSNLSGVVNLNDLNPETSYNYIFRVEYNDGTKDTHYDKHTYFTTKSTPTLEPDLDIKVNPTSDGSDINITINDNGVIISSIQLLDSDKNVIGDFTTSDNNSYNYSITDLEPGDYHYLIRVNYKDGSSDLYKDYDCDFTVPSPISTPTITIDDDGIKEIDADGKGTNDFQVTYEIEGNEYPGYTTVQHQNTETEIWESVEEEQIDGWTSTSGNYYHQNKPILSSTNGIHTFTILNPEVGNQKYRVRMGYRESGDSHHIDEYTSAQININVPEIEKPVNPITDDNGNGILDMYILDSDANFFADGIFNDENGTEEFNISQSLTDPEHINNLIYSIDIDAETNEGIDLNLIDVDGDESIDWLDMNVSDDNYYEYPLIQDKNGNEGFDLNGDNLIDLELIYSPTLLPIEIDFIDTDNDHNVDMMVIYNKDGEIKRVPIISQ